MPRKKRKDNYDYLKGLKLVDLFFEYETAAWIEHDGGLTLYSTVVCRKEIIRRFRLRHK